MALKNKLQHFLTPYTNKQGKKSPAARNWMLYEFFYPSIDRGYFNHNEFQECLNELGLGKVQI